MASDDEDGAGFRVHCDPENGAYGSPFDEPADAYDAMSSRSDASVTAESIRSIVVQEIKASRRRRTKERDCLVTPAFDAFRKTFPNGPLENEQGGYDPAVVRGWEANFATALESDHQKAVAAAWGTNHEKHGGLVRQIAALHSRTAAEIESEVGRGLSVILQKLDQEANAALLAIGGSAIPATWEAEWEERKKASTAEFTAQVRRSAEAAHAKELKALEEERLRLEGEVSATMVPHLAHEAKMRKALGTILARVRQKNADLEREAKAKEVGDAVTKNVASRAGDGIGGDILVVATSAVMGGMQRISRRQTFYRVLRWAAAVALLLVVSGGLWYAWHTRALHALFRRAPIFSRNTVVAKDRELLALAPDPVTDYDHFLWMMNTTGLCTRVSAADFAGNMVTVPWSVGGTMHVTLTSIERWMHMHANGSGCFCAQHIGVGVFAMRLARQESAYVMFNPAPANEVASPAVCNPGLQQDDRIVRFTSAVRDEWVVEDDGPLPAWTTNPPFTFPAPGSFKFQDVAGATFTIHLYEAEAACYGYCKTLCK